MSSDPKQILCKIQVGGTVREFYVYDDLLDAHPCLANDQRQDEAMRTVRLNFVAAYNLERRNKQ